VNLPEAASALVTTALVPALGPDWLDPEYILTSFGDIAFWVVVGIIFAECGLLIGFFLPGDSLLFVTGLFIASGAISMNIYLACLILFVAAVVGNVTGYWIGYKAGPSLFSRPESRFFKMEYVEHTHRFFNKYGARAIIMARFVPIVRTFITATAGIGRMDFRKYIVFSAIGGFLWTVGFTLAGYFLGNIEFVKKNLEFIVILVVFVSVVPIVFEYVKHRRERAGLE
jgi:membrane-associated protein